MESTNIEVVNGDSVPSIGGEIGVQVAKDVSVFRLDMQEKVSKVVIVNEVGITGANQCIDGCKPCARIIRPKMGIVLKENNGLRLLNELNGLPEDVKVESFRIGLQQLRCGKVGWSARIARKLRSLTEP